VTVTVTVPTTESLALLLAAESPVELAVAELIVTEVEIAVVDELSSSPSSQSPSSSGSFAPIEPLVLFVSFPVMPP
jgi:hypothetical protein